MNPPAHVSIRQIAERAHVSHSTVSLALRNSSRLSAATRDRVQELARKMGWKPNPAVSAWMAHRRGIAPPSAGESILFLNSWPDLEEWRRSPWMVRYANGARQRAGELGFGFEELAPADSGMEAQRVENILQARGARGLLIGSLPSVAPAPELDWSRYAAVSQSFSVLSPAVSSATGDYFQNMRTALDELRKLGYRRIGYAFSPELEERTCRLHLGSYLGSQSLRPAAEQVGLLDWTRPDSEVLSSWIRNQKPDALLSHDFHIGEMLRAAGIDVPGRIGLASLSIHPGWEAVHPQLDGLAGIDQQLEHCGRVAIDMLVSRLAHNETGPPQIPITAQVPGKWVHGRTVRGMND